MKWWLRLALTALTMVLVAAALAAAGCVGPDTPTSSSDPVTTPGKVTEQPASEPVALEGADWTVTAYSNAEEALVPVIAGTKVTARFEDGTLKGDTGVNIYEGSYDMDGDSLALDPAFQVTERAGSPEAMDQEGAYLAALGRTKVYRIEDGVLTLFDEEGVRLVTFE